MDKYNEPPKLIDEKRKMDETESICVWRGRIDD